jgi:RNA polymerase sigma-70 factor (ECF subfamily)
MIARLQSDEQALEALCRRYWKPVYHYLRTVLARSNDDAKDLTQAFFLSLLEGGALQKYDRALGSFRKFLKVLLGGFTSDHDKAVQRLKRGGGKKIVNFEELDDTLSGGATDPEQAFNQAWAKQMAREAIDRVRRRFASTGREKQFEVFDAYDLRGDKSTYSELAQRLGLKEADVRNYLFAVREAVRIEIRQELSELTEGERDIDEEWNALFGG